MTRSIRRGQVDELHPQVVERGNRIEATPHLAEVARVLIDGARSNRNLRAMWRSVERASANRGLSHGDEWVLVFLNSAHWASQGEPYIRLPMKARRAKAKRIARLATQLVDEIQSNGLDAHMVRPPRHSNWGWLYYEDMSDSNQRRCEADREPKLLASGLIAGVAERAAKLLETEHYPGAQVEQASAIRFCRRLVDMNELAFGEGVYLYEAVATAANALFHTSFSKAEVINHMAR